MAGKERLPDGRMIVRHPSGKVELVEHDGWISPDGDPVLEGLYAALNIEGCAKAGAYKGLDVPWHFEKVRAAIRAREAELRAGALAVTL